MKAYGGVEFLRHTFFSSYLDWGGREASNPSPFSRAEKVPGGHRIGGRGAMLAPVAVRTFWKRDKSLALVGTGINFPRSSNPVT